MQKKCFAFFYAFAAGFQAAFLPGLYKTAMPQADISLSLEKLNSLLRYQANKALENAGMKVLKSWLQK